MGENAGSREEGAGQRRRDLRGEESAGEEVGMAGNRVLRKMFAG